MRSTLLFVLVVFALVAVPAWALAGTVEGTVQGFTCVTTGKVCPVGKEDPMIAAERVFVVLDSDGKTHHFVSNLDRAILARHINQMVRVTGEVNAKYSAIKAEKLEVKGKGGWEMAWSKALQDEMLKANW
ncbi:MAG: hypothetical protein SWQ30_10010 [Thermodesulfobacteriota bacterium]|nr:hypothetical protein [Thermodesulfobacteriota bacterium]